MALLPSRTCQCHRPPIAAVLVSSLLLAACGGPETMIASSLLSAAVRTAMDQANKNRPTPEQRWREAQLASLQRRAVAGDPEAQFQMGTYYLVRQQPMAQKWICAAANQGHAKAQLQYGHWFNEDRSREDLFPFITVTPDNATAYMWYDLAAGNGDARAPLFRDSLVDSGMPADALERGRAHVAAWTPGACPGEIIATAPSSP